MSACAGERSKAARCVLERIRLVGTTKPVEVIDSAAAGATAVAAVAVSGAGTAVVSGTVASCVLMSVIVNGNVNAMQVGEWLQEFEMLTE
jgi:hypothetical protein